MSLFDKKQKIIPEMLCVQIESGARIWYNIKKGEKVTQIFGGMDSTKTETEEEDSKSSSDKKQSKPYLSISKNDFRIQAKKAMNNKEALSTLIRASENTELLSVINESKTGVIYGTQMVNLKNDDNQVIPVFSLYEVTDKVLKSADHPAGEEALVIYQLAKDDGSDLLIFMNLSESGNLSYKAAIFEENSQEAINTHMLASGFKKSVKAYTVTNDDLFEAFESFAIHNYPVEVPLISMRNINLITPFIAAGMAVGVAGIFVWGSMNGMALSKAKDDFNMKQIELSDKNDEIGQTLKLNPAGYAKLTSVDFDSMFKESQMLYLDTAKFTVSATPVARTYSMSLRIRENTGKSSASLNEEDLLTASITRKIEEPCTLNGIIFSGDLNEIKTNYTCKVTNFNFGDIGL